MAAMMASQTWLDAPTLAQRKKLQGKAEPASNGAGKYGRLQLTLALQWNDETSIMNIGMKKMSGIHWDARLAQLRGPRSLLLDQIKHGKTTWNNYWRHKQGCLNYGGYLSDETHGDFDPSSRMGT